MISSVFSFDSTETLIRANQGHSVAVDLELPPSVPPQVLYHGTYEQCIEIYFSAGIEQNAATSRSPIERFRYSIISRSKKG